VSDGNDKGSTHSWNELRTSAQATGVAIFGLSSEADEPKHVGFHDLNIENQFNSVCELTGGMVLTTGRRGLSEALKRFTSMLRERYVVEFPRPFHSTIGEHNLAITIDESDAFIRPAGIAVPMADPAVQADPLTVPSDPSRTPELGKRRILTAPQ
jgi:hypothetical protein